MGQCKLILILGLLISLCGCEVVRPVTRFEHNSNIYYPKAGKAVDANKQFIVAGPEAKIGKISTAVLVGPEIYENENEQYEGIQINPRVFYFFNESSFLHLEIDHSFMSNGNGQDTFILFAVEKRW